MAELHDLTVKPWGRIEGTLRVAGRPVAHKTVIASLDEERPDSEWTRIQNESRAKTDEQGRFVIERVAPGEARGLATASNQARGLCPIATISPRSWTCSRAEWPAWNWSRRVAAPLWDASSSPIPEVGLSIWRGATSFLVPRIPVVPYPTDLPEGERKEWLHRWRFTEAARDYRQKRRGFGHTLKLQPDGSFRLDEVQPGAYELHVQVKGFAKLVYSFSIPEPTAGQDGGAVELGVHPLKR